MLQAQCQQCQDAEGKRTFSTGEAEVADGAPEVAWGAEGGGPAAWRCAAEKVKTACERAFSALRCSLSLLSASAKGSEESPSCMSSEAFMTRLGGFLSETAYHKHEYDTVPHLQA